MNNALIVTDSGPLISLSTANSLDVLLKQPLPIQIPDAVYKEVAVNTSRKESRDIAEWAANNPSRISIVATTIGRVREQRIEAGLSVRDYGEKAAIETATRHLNANPNNRVMLLCDDMGARKFALESDPRINVVMTAALLQRLETAHLIPSAREILDKANQQGNNMQRQFEELVKPPSHAVADLLPHQTPIQNTPPVEAKLDDEINRTRANPKGFPRSCC